MELPENAVILASEPLKGLLPSNVRQWLFDNDSELGLATAHAQVHNQVGWLGHDLDELEEPELSKAEAVYDEWCNLENELFQKILEILQNENTLGIAKHDLTVAGRFYIVKPFMERNWYRDGAGWWVKNQN